MEAHFDVTQLADVASVLLGALGASQSTAELVGTSLARSNLLGHDSHGVVRLLDYADQVRCGQIQPRAEASVARRQGGVAVVDGAWGFGQPAAGLATDVTADLAAECGVAATVIGACNHIGRVGEYVERLARQGLVGMAWCNAGPAVSPFGGGGRVLGTNPLAWAVPAGDGPVVLDFATSVVAEGKVRIARADGRRVPAGSILDREGRPSDDPHAFYAGGSLVPFGGHKGSGLSMLIELTGGLLSGMGAGCVDGYGGGNGTVLVALSVASFMPLAAYQASVETFCAEAKQLGERQPGGHVRLPGEPEAATARERQASGVLVAPDIRRAITALADELDVSIGSFALRAA